MLAPVQERAGFLRFIEIDAGEAAAHADAFDQIRAGTLQAVVVHNVYDAPTMAAVVDRLERHDPPLLRTWFPEQFHAWFYGQNLNMAHPDLPNYFEQAALFNAQIDELFPAGQGLAARVGGILATLDGGRPFVAAPGPLPHQRYMFTTMRAHLDEGFLPPHFDNEQALRPTYRHLHSIAELHMTSYVLTFSAAEIGGTLDVYNLLCDPESAVPISHDGAAPPDISQMEPASFAIPAGSMIVLDSGRYLHSVSPVRGSRKRWTACSFMSLSRKRDATYCWG
jgi:hypothetical protein